MRIFAAVVALAMMLQEPLSIKVDVHLQQIVATVRDSAGHNVKGLKKEDFILEDSGVRQEIVHFSGDPDTPISLAILIDTTGSMGRMPGGAESGVLSAVAITRVLLHRMKPDDEISLMTFGDDFLVRQGFTKDRSRLEAALSGVRADGTMNVLSALKPAVQQLHKAKYAKRALIIMTDAYFSGDIKHAANEVYQAEVPIFTFAMRGVDFGPRVHYCTSACHPFETLPFPQTSTLPDLFPNLTQPFLETLANESGGHSTIFEMDPRNTMQRINSALDDIAAELRGQYLLGYYPTSTITNRVIRVRSVTPGYRVHFRREDQQLGRP